MTAVEWLVNQVNSDCTNSVFIQQHLVNQAIEIEKKQIEDAFDYGFADGYDDGRYDDVPIYLGSENYYNETYKTQKQ